MESIRIREDTDERFREEGIQIPKKEVEVRWLSGGAVAQ